MPEIAQAEPDLDEKQAKALPFCFRTPELKTLRLGPGDDPFSPQGSQTFDLAGLADRSAEALGHLVPHLLCGEESAVLVFFHRSRSKADMVARELMWKISGEEKVHELMISRLMSTLPAPEELSETQQRGHDFYLSMASTDAAAHFAGISALDSGVCQIMAALCSSRSTLKTCPTVYGIFSRILREEAGHVRFSHHYATQRGFTSTDMNRIAEPIRDGLATLLTPAGHAFEALGIDPDRLFGRIRREFS